MALVSLFIMRFTLLILFCTLLACINITQGLNCYKCGQYNDGVGSITPCINYTAIQLKECPDVSEYCIKYISEGSIVRDCVPSCVEKEAWSTRTYCCNVNGCNGTPLSAGSTSFWISGAFLLIIMH